MDLLGDIRNLLARGRRALGIELDSNEAERHSSGEGESNAKPGSPSSTSSGSDDRVRFRLVPENLLSQEALLNSVRELREKVEQQYERAQSAIAQFKVPDELRTLPEIAQQNARSLQAISDRLAQTDTRREAIDAALENLQDTMEQHAALLGLLQQQLDSNAQSTSRLVESLNTLQPRLIELADSDQHTKESLARIASATSQRGSEMLQGVSEIRKWSKAAMALSGIAALAALGAVIVAAIR